MTCVGLGAACFSELPSVPGEMTTTTTTATEEAPTSDGGSEGSSGVVSTTQVASTATDGDTVGTTGAPAAPDMGLFGCFAETCAPWQPPDCAGSCGPPDAAGACLLTLLRDRAAGRGDVRTCSGSCVRTAFVARAGGTDAVSRQTAVEVPEGLGDYKELKRCTLREPAFFDACLAGLTSECVDSSNWYADCVDGEDLCM